MASAAAAHATTYYVDSTARTANDHNSGTSPDWPWRTLLNVSGLGFRPGDIIALRAGSSYGGGLVISSSGTAQAPITFTSYGVGLRPLITNDPTPGTYSDAVQLIRANYIVIKGLAFTSASQSGVNITSKSNYNRVENCESFKTGIGIKVAGQYNVLVRNYLHDLVMVKNTGSGSDYGANGFVISAPNNELAYNACLRCKAASLAFGWDGGMFELYGPVDNAYIHHNVSQDSEGFVEAGVGTARNVRIIYNKAYNNNGSFMTVHYTGTFAYNRGKTSFVVANNTIVDTVAANPGALNYIDAPSTSTSIVFLNNIIVVNRIGSIYKYDIPRKNNLYYFMQASTHLLNNWGDTLGPGEIKANPLFVNVTNGDFHLTAPSPARAKGLAKGLALTPPATVDLDGVPVPAVPDLGAYQYPG